EPPPGLASFAGANVRGQRRPGPFVEGFVARSKALMANPVFVAAAVGTAVAVPVAIANADDDDAATP
ncbi:MAG: hypothetical protein AAFV43_08190, partial [Planctomycetota bacterium]